MHIKALKREHDVLGCRANHYWATIPESNWPIHHSDHQQHCSSSPPTLVLAGSAATANRRDENRRELGGAAKPAETEAPAASGRAHAGNRRPPA